MLTICFAVFNIEKKGYNYLVYGCINILKQNKKKKYISKYFNL